MSVQRISSFKSFTEVKNQQASIKMHEENKTKREQLLAKIGQTLEEEGVTSFDELDEEKRTALVAKIFNEDRAEDIEAAKVKMGEPKKHEDEEGKKVQSTNESLVTEATRSQIGKIDKAGKITSVYVHWDGSPDTRIPLLKNYKDSKSLNKLLDLGKYGISSLEKQIGDKPQDFNNPEKGITTFYGRDRNEKNDMTMKSDVKSIAKYLKDAGNHSSAEYVYLFDERDGKWYMADVYDDKELKPVKESLEVNEESGKMKLIRTGKPENIYYVFYKGQFDVDYSAMGPRGIQLYYKDKFKVRKPRGSQFDFNPDFKIVSKTEYEKYPESYKELKPFVDKFWDEFGVKESLEVNEALSPEQKMVEAFLKKIAKEFDYSMQDAAGFVIFTISKMGLKESVEVNEDIDIHDNTSVLMQKLQVQIGNLLHAAKGNKEWTKELEAIKSAFEKLEDRFSIASKKLGMIPESVEVNESEEYVAYIELEKGKKLIDTFKDYKAAKSWADKNVDKLLDDEKIERVGTMPKSKWDKEEAKHAIKEGEDLNEADTVWSLWGKKEPMGLNKAETKKVAELYAKAISKKDNCKCTVNQRTLEEDSFDLDVDGEEFAGGSYNIYDDGQVVNMAIKSGVAYGKYNDSVDTIVKNLKSIKESVLSESKESDEAENILDDILGERDMEEIHGMSMEDALDTVEAYGHSGSKAKKIAKELYSLCNESNVNEARSINKIQNEWTKVTAEMKSIVDSWKKAEGDAKAPLLAKLKELTAKKNSLESELNDAIADKDKDLELVVSEGNAFVYAAAKAKQEGKKEFEFNGKTYKVSISDTSLKEEVAVEINEEDITSDEQFKEYAFKVLKQAFEADFDEAKAQEVVDGILKVAGSNYGEAVGMLTASLG